MTEPDRGYAATFLVVVGLLLIYICAYVVVVGPRRKTFHAPAGPPTTYVRFHTRASFREKALYYAFYPAGRVDRALTGCAYLRKRRPPPLIYF